MADTERRFTIRYEYADYTGTSVVWAEDEEQAVARMWANMRHDGLLTIPNAYRAATVVAVAESSAELEIE